MSTDTGHTIALAEANDKIKRLEARVALLEHALRHIPALFSGLAMSTQQIRQTIKERFGVDV